MVNEVQWKLGLRSAKLLSTILHKFARSAFLELDGEDRVAYRRLVEELDRLIGHTPVRMVKVTVINGDNNAGGEST
jgi:hypothetical protein